MDKKILVVTGDAGESYEAWYARHRLQEADYVPVIAAPSKRRLHLVMHDFEPGWDTYVERPGYGMELDISFDDVNVDDYGRSWCLAAEPLNTCAITRRWYRSCESSARRANGCSRFAMASRCLSQQGWRRATT